MSSAFSHSSTNDPAMVLRVSAEDALTAQQMPRHLRLRLLPEVEAAPVLALVSDSPIAIGRSPADADFIAQFRPRGSVKDGRTRRIGRVQTYLQLRLDRLRIDEPDALNPTIVLDTPMRQRAAVSLPARIVIAGEYGLNIQLCPSVYAPHGRRLEGWNGCDVSLLQGALTVVPESVSGSFPCQAALVVSDVMVALDSRGRPKWRLDKTVSPAGCIHRFGGQFWWQDLLADQGQENLHLLLPDKVVKMGAVHYRVQALDLKLAGLFSEDTTLSGL